MAYDIKTLPKLKTGCKLADIEVGGTSDCFTCPFPECYRGNQEGAYKLRRDRGIMAKAAAGNSLEDLMGEYRVSRRTIERVLNARRS